MTLFWMSILEWIYTTKEMDMSGLSRNINGVVIEQIVSFVSQFSRVWLILQFIKWLSQVIIKNELTGMKTDCDGIPLGLLCSFSLSFGNEISFIICFFCTLVVCLFFKTLLNDCGFWGCFQVDVLFLMELRMKQCFKSTMKCLEDIQHDCSFSTSQTQIIPFPVWIINPSIHPSNKQSNSISVCLENIQPI